MVGYVRAPERREQLLAAARGVLVREGLDGLTLRDVAAEAGVHLSTLQYIFSSRAELVGALVQRVLQEARYGQFEPGSGDLRHELHRLLDWYATQFLSDPAMVELLRYEYLVSVRRADGQAPDHPLAGRLVASDFAQRIARIAEQAQEPIDWSVEELGRVWGVGVLGLFYEFLRDHDLERFRREGELVIDWVARAATLQPAHGG